MSSKGLSQNPNRIYTEISIDNVPSNRFDKTHAVAMTFKPGELAPCLMLPVHPGDYVDIGAIMMARFPALVAPAMFSGSLSVNYFYVSNRVVWESFDEWFANPDDVPFGQPKLPLDAALDSDQERFLDMFGVPPVSASTAKEALNVLPYAFAAYNKVYNDYFRPRPFEDEIPYKLPAAGGALGPSWRTDLLQIRYRSWEHDYHTSMLPEPLVSPDVNIGIDIALKDDWQNFGTPKWMQAGIGVPTGDGNVVQSSAISQTVTTSIPSLQPNAYDPDGTLEGTSLVNILREAYARQRYLERIGRAGGEYYEIIRAQYGKWIPDARLQRSEYICGLKSHMSINPVLSTAATDDAPVAEQSGHGVLAGSSDGQRGFSVDEHGYIIGIASFVPKPMYGQGVPKHLRSFDRTDYITPDFTNIGEQAVDSSEITAYEEPEGTLTTMGYLPNYTHYKQMQSRVAGLFRSSLAHYVMGKYYDTTSGIPALNKEFIQINPDCMDHLFVVKAGITDPIWFNILHNIEHQTCLPVYSDPI